MQICNNKIIHVVEEIFDSIVVIKFLELFNDCFSAEYLLWNSIKR